MKEILKKYLPEGVVDKISNLKQRTKRPFISKATGKLDPKSGKQTFVMIVGHTFDQRRPDAYLTCRMGYCNAFETLGIPYIIIDFRDAPTVLDQLPDPFCMLYAADLVGISDKAVKTICQYPSGVWTQPWFKNSDEFFKRHDLDARNWTFSNSFMKRILQLNCNFGFTATVPSGLNFFENWDKEGLKTISLPLACDSTVYNKDEIEYSPAFKDVNLAFVGGYWNTKGIQIDNYLRKWEDELTVYGYSKWPYKGYKGQIQSKYEPQLLKQARVCPVVNEPTVALLKGQINERVFKVLGSGGCPVVDAVPAYRELYSSEELLVAENVNHFHSLINEVLNNPELNLKFRERGRIATLARHTYIHRAHEFMRNCGILYNNKDADK